MEIKNKDNLFYMGEESNPRAFIKYNIENGVFTLESTVVNPEFRGQGLAGIITKYVFDYIRENNLKLQPLCSYSIKYIEKNPEYEDILG